MSGSLPGLTGLVAAGVRAAEAAGIERTLRFGRAFGRSWDRLHGPRRGRVTEQLARAFPEADAVLRRSWRREVFEHLGQGLAELVVLAGRHRARLVERMQVDGLEHLEVARRAAGGRGVLVVGPHLGNWELARARLSDLGRPIHFVHRPLESATLERAVRQIRTAPTGAATAEAIAMGPRAGVQLRRALESGRDVFVLLDQRAAAREGLAVEFFGRPAMTRFGPLKLADRAGSPVVFGVTRREPDGLHHRLRFEPALQLEPGAADDEKVLRRNLQCVTAEIERAIRASPGQWIWTHGRWRGAPRALPAD